MLVSFITFVVGYLAFYTDNNNYSLTGASQIKSKHHILFL